MVVEKLFDYSKVSISSGWLVVEVSGVVVDFWVVGFCW